MKSRVIWIVIGVVLFLFSAVTFAVIKIVPSKRQLAVPQSMVKVQEFVSSHSNAALYEDINDIVPEVEKLKNQEILVSSLSVNDKQVQFMATKLESKKEAREFYKDCKNQLKGNIQIASINFDTSNYYYWTAIVAGEKIYLWQKDEWVVLIKGESSAAVKELKHEFEDRM